MYKQQRAEEAAKLQEATEEKHYTRGVVVRTPPVNIDPDVEGVPLPAGLNVPSDSGPSAVTLPGSSSTN